MNKRRRATIKSVVDLLEKASDIIQGVLDEEQDCLDNIPENLQNSDRFGSMEEAVVKLDDAYNGICDSIGLLSEILV